MIAEKYLEDAWLLVVMAMPVSWIERDGKATAKSIALRDKIAEAIERHVADAVTHERCRCAQIAVAAQDRCKALVHPFGCDCANGYHIAMDIERSS